jgi:hypothetical protein
MMSMRTVATCSTCCDLSAIIDGGVIPDVYMLLDYNLLSDLDALIVWMPILSVHTLVARGMCVT